MTLEILGSSSAGNCYILKAARSTLVVECGLPIARIKRGLGFSLANVDGCIISHAHNDHAGSVADVAAAGIHTYALQEVLDKAGSKGAYFLHPIEPKHGYRIGAFKVYTLPLNHDVPCLGFVIEHPEMGRTLFATDTATFPYHIDGLNHILIEANYDQPTLEYNIDNGIGAAAAREQRLRLARSHMEYDTTLAAIKENQTPDLRTVVLIHLSGDNSSAEEYIRRTTAATGLATYIARPDMQIDLSLMPY